MRSMNSAYVRVPKGRAQVRPHQRRNHRADSSPDRRSSRSGRRYVPAFQRGPRFLRLSLRSLMSFVNVVRMAKVMAGTRLEQATIDRLDKIAAEMGRRSGGLEVSRSDATRAAILHGVDVLEQEFGLVAAPKGAAPARKPKK